MIPVPGAADYTLTLVDGIVAIHVRRDADGYPAMLWLREAEAGRLGRDLVELVGGAA